MARRRKEKVQDETLVDIVEVKGSLQDYFENNKMLVLGGIAALVLLLGGYMFYKFGIVQPRAEEAQTSLFRAENQFARDSFALALESPGGDAEGFLDIIENYSGTKQANLAKYYAGVSYLNLGRFDEAIEYLNSFDASGSALLGAMKNGAIGDAYSELEQYDKAMSAYASASKGGDEFSAPYYLNKLGLLKKKQGDTSGALAAFKQIDSKFPNSTEARSATRYITLLENM